MGRGAEIYLMLLLPSRGPGMESGDKHLALTSPSVLRVNGGPGNILVCWRKAWVSHSRPSVQSDQILPRERTEPACTAAAAPRGTQSRDATEPPGRLGNARGC